MPESRPDHTLNTKDLTEVAPGIFYTQLSFVVADEEAISFLKRQASENAVGRARICAHPDAEAEQHDMLIVSNQNTYVAPHRHLSKSESFCVLEGEADILMFDEKGGLTKKFRMGPAGQGLPFFYRMPARQYHSLDIKSEFLVFLESTKGPFVKSDMECAPWAPDAQDWKNGRDYISTLSNTQPDDVE